MSCHSSTQSHASPSPSLANGIAGGVSPLLFIRPLPAKTFSSSLVAPRSKPQSPAALLRVVNCMNSLYSTATMCCACEPRLPALKMPKLPHRPQPTGPQYFTFDPLPEVERSPVYNKSSRTTRIKKRSRRVLYPPVVRRYYPAKERSFAKRLLVILLAIVFFQIYSAEEDLSHAAASAGAEQEGPLAKAGESRCEPFFLPEQPGTAGGSLELQAAANTTGRPWGNGETSASTIIDITQFLLYRAAF